jgi:hypothetical protein
MKQYTHKRVLLCSADGMSGEFMQLSGGAWNFRLMAKIF